MQIPVTRQTVEKYIPNILIDTDGEQSLYDKLTPYIDVSWSLLSNETGDIDYMDDSHKDILVNACIKKAFATAIPSLDLVITPTGFGVVSTNALAPASKDRVSRLVESLHSESASLFAQFIAVCRTYPEWRESEQGRRFCMTFLTMDDVMAINSKYAANCSLLCTTYYRLSGMALTFERELAENYLGDEVLTRLLEISVDNTQLTTDNAQLTTVRLISLIKTAELAYLKKHINGDTYRCPDSHEIWHAAAPVLSALKSSPEIYQLWKDTMEEKFQPEPFQNNTQGGFFF